MLGTAWRSLPDQVVSRSLHVADLDMHILEAGENHQPLVVLLHGFPELSYSWRKVITPIADAGFHVVAPDQRGFGRTVSSPIRYDDDLFPYRMLNLVRDVVALVSALGYSSVAAVVGHDSGSRVAAHCALIRPDLFKSLIMMSAPFAGVQPLPFKIETSPSIVPPTRVDIFKQLTTLDPPRKHYTAYYSTWLANEDMINAPQGLHAFLRAYFHVKSADWPEHHRDTPHPLDSWGASALAAMPHYYVMPLYATMPEAVAPHAPESPNVWFPDEELAVYTTEYTRTGFQGGLNSYRCLNDTRMMDDLAVFSRKTIDVPTMFISGRQDWGVWQSPGVVEKMQDEGCVNMSKEDFVLVDGAGHWIQQEQPEELLRHILRFLYKVHPSKEH